MSEFFDALFPRNLDPLDLGWIELRHLHNGAVRARNWIRTSLPQDVEMMARAHQDEDDVYFGVLPRIRHGAGDSDAIADQTHVLWGDYDPKGMDKRKVFMEITRLQPQPQIVVDSGSGYHVYWLLDAPVDFDSAKMVMNEIAAQTHGDHVSDKARILRVPGTLNHKTVPPKPVRLLRLDLLRRRYKLSDFSDYFDNRDDGTVQSSFEDTFGEPQRRKGMVPQDIPTWLAALIEKDPGHGARSEHAFHVAACLAEIGQTDEEIEVIFQANPQGVGAKYAEKGDRGHQWLMTTLRSVRSRV